MQPPSNRKISISTDFDVGGEPGNVKLRIKAI